MACEVKRLMGQRGARWLCAAVCVSKAGWAEADDHVPLPSPPHALPRLHGSTQGHSRSSSRPPPCRTRCPTPPPVPSSTGCLEPDLTRNAGSRGPACLWFARIKDPSPVTSHPAREPAVAQSPHHVLQIPLGPRAPHWPFRGTPSEQHNSDCQGGTEQASAIVVRFGLGTHRLYSLQSAVCEETASERI